MNSRPTKEDMEYDDWQKVAEIMCDGPNPEDECSFFEEIPNGFEIVKNKCKQYFAEYPGPIHEGWLPPSDEQLDIWLKEFWLSQDQIDQIKNETRNIESEMAAKYSNDTI